MNQPAATLELPGPTQARYRVTGMDCSSCAAKIEQATRTLPGVAAVKVSIASQEMTITVDDGTGRLPLVERTVRDLGYHLMPIGQGRDDDDDRVPDLTHVTPAYGRALWIVVLLNVGYGAIEIVGGLLAGSQALKADALDFLGDGLISFLGLIAIGWGAAPRARAALAQGLFLGAMGAGVLVLTTYRVFVLNSPEADLMGLFGIIALVINVLCALILIPHRQGDANVRAVWLFSRNDALGNLTVVLAAGLVAWTGTPWPDLAVAAIIAGLFLHASWSIITDANAELTAQRASTGPGRGGQK